jgi:hypothetical protein
MIAAVPGPMVKIAAVMCSHKIACSGKVKDMQRS